MTKFLQAGVWLSGASASAIAVIFAIVWVEPIGRWVGPKDMSNDLGFVLLLGFATYIAFGLLAIGLGLTTLGVIQRRKEAKK